MSDLISRQAAITAICEDGTWLESQGCTEITMCERKQRDADILSELPTIDAEPVRYGRWEYKHFSSEPHCSLCLAEYPIETNYCPNCGAKMDGGGRKEKRQ